MFDLRRSLADKPVLTVVDRGERLLARVLSLLLLLVLAVATIQLLWQVGRDLIDPNHAWMGDSLLVLLGDLLNLLIGLEVLQNITAYLRRGVVQIQLVLLTAITAVGRKVIVLPPGAEDKPLLLFGLGVAVLCLAGAFWLVRLSGDVQPELSGHAKTEPTKSSPDTDRSP